MNNSLRRVPLLPALLILFLLFGCRLFSGAPAEDTPTSTAIDGPTVAPVTQSTQGSETATLAPTMTATSEPFTATAVASQSVTTTVAVTPTWAPPVPLPDRFDDEPVTAAQDRSAAELDGAVPPERDDVALAIQYKEYDAEDGGLQNQNESPEVGETSPFNVLNIDSNVNVAIEARLLAASEHAYFWFDAEASLPDEDDLQTSGKIFDRIYERTVDSFGSEVRPGIDGDLRLHILHASPAALCDEANRCGILGYFSSSDALPREVNEFSNERDMFVMNAESFDTGAYLSVLAHEFRHMIEDNYDRSDLDWEIEGSAVLAEELAGFTFNALDRGNAFLENPDLQLNRWSDGNTYPRYGQGYVLNRYIYDRLGPDLYREFATHPGDGLDAVTAVARANGLEMTGHSLWLDWLAALAIHDQPATPQRYRLGDGSLDTVTVTEVDGPQSFDANVRQYAADYYRLTGQGRVELRFQGSRHVPLLPVAPRSGSHYWYAQRANYSHLQLTRAFDLREVQSATLNYSVFHDIEYGYDFAYVSASTDGGNTWQGLVADGMHGLLEADNPADAALTERFYTGQSEGWIEESIDLTAYAGQEILVRFSYVTDPILTYGGPALDNISVPEIGFFEDAEDEGAGWEAAGFSRVTGTLPQQWHVQLITFEGGAPSVTPLQADESRQVTHTVDLGASGGEAILIVAATAPKTLEEAPYHLQIGQ